MENLTELFGKVIVLALFVLGICLIIGAIKNWNWLYEEDKHYQNNWNMGQISRYLGRDVARVIGFVGGIFLTIIGGYLLYGIFFS